MTTYEEKYIESLKSEIPDDVLRYRKAGMFKEAVEAIDRWIMRNVSREMNERLLIEKEHIGLLQDEFPFTEKEALDLARQDIPEFTAEDLKALDDAGVCEWIYIDGKKHYFDRFWETATHVVKELSDLVHGTEGDPESQKLLTEALSAMKQNGSAKYRTTAEVTYRLHDDVFTPGMELKVWLPIPAEQFQTSDVQILETSHEVKEIAGNDAPARTVFFHEKLEKNETFSVKYSFVTENRYVDARNSADQAVLGTYDFDVDELQPHVRFSPYLRALSSEIVGDEKNPIRIAEKIFDYVTSRVKYSYMRDYFLLDDIPQYCARNLRGDCGVQALLFITLCRMNGVPARWQSGMCSAGQRDFGAHDWAMFYVEPFGWLFADPSYGGSAYRDGDEERRWFYFGNLDPFRVTANHEFQAPLTPAKKYRRYDPYDNQAGEAETPDFGISGGDRDIERRILSIEKLD